MITLQKDAERQEVQEIEVLKIAPNPNQPRKVFNEDSIIKLADSINQYGIIQPLTVRKTGETYELVAGERRLRAAKELGKTSVPCIVIDINTAKSAEISIIENLIREDLNMFEQAEAIESLIDTYGLTQEQIALKLSNSQSFVANKLRLLRLTKEEREIILKNKLTERHARSLLRVFDNEQREKLLKSIVDNNLNVASTEILIDNYINKAKENASTTGEAQHNSKQYKDLGSFSNAILRAIDCAKSSNLDIKTRKIVGESFTEITITMPNMVDKQEKNTEY
jgi:ParB family chromosome partitioning protein